MSEILIKNMVCPRCIMAVEDIFRKLEVPISGVELGKVTVTHALTNEQEKHLEDELKSLGFGLIRTKESRLIEKVKSKLYQLLQEEEIPTSLNLSSYLIKEINEDYSKLSHLFSQDQGITIEKFFIRLKLEKTKELLFNQELQLSEIAWRLGYNSVQHLSNQFKKVTGITPSAYKKMKEKPRVGLDEVK
ncbi:helix-turn-helix transcriptional regulator [Echinicola sp. CAU 1574]|uniref:Helix-turn-helix transcriptional regulator n=1 Tax=Echinicola arenosa TaxID=2774144 RepID=A0ABR9AM00_9BACT|nr:AraC family transcriptional regulator [Echinicola arenosa]MBD8489840.1 helix-turn-helix transcriptional regulator [Echinicola arenosa]